MYHQPPLFDASSTTQNHQKPDESRLLEAWFLRLRVAVLPLGGSRLPLRGGWDGGGGSGFHLLRLVRQAGACSNERMVDDADA